ncbi:carboxypeptidase-like regulatory domain-containing protein [Larkinella soli]|uniref:carboxypeptidase-like regulatory domain-containing protein n=1 Tax=Larkinella soli TaxID=1770527 RepID=UPI000FFB0CD2|nr:carboxypeptidase-like regulatory domain-containing protein [Larkinella soli]
MKNALLFLLMGVGLVVPGRAQTIRNGLVTDRVSQLPVASATIQNTTLGRATLSTETGRFRITALPNDTLLISCIGYKTERLVVPAEDQELIVRLVQDVKTLNEVVIKGWTESKFKQEFMKLNLPDKPVIDIRMPVEPVIMLGNAGRIGADPVSLAPKISLKGPVSALYDAFSRQAKMERKLQELQKAEGRKQQYRNRLDPVWISRITDLKGERLAAFLKFCQLPEPFVLTSTDYDLIVAIKGCLKDFLVQEKSEKG